MIAVIKGLSITLVASKAPAHTGFQNDISAGCLQTLEMPPPSSLQKMLPDFFSIYSNYGWRQIPEIVVFYWLSRDHYAFIEFDEMRRCITIHLIPGSFKNSMKISNQRPFPFVPATWITGGRCLCGEPRNSKKFSTRCSPDQ